MPDPAPRRSLAARRCTKQTVELHDDFDDKENSLNDSLSGRRQSRLLNGSFNGVDEPAQTPRQLVDLYQKTLELATQGKINIKNAFNIPLVERLPQVLSVIALDDKENNNLGPNFVKAGSVIDTSAKIYGFRVDALHTETQKLSGNILNTNEESTADGVVKEEGQTEANEENNNAEQTEAKKPVRRVKPKTTTFILTDISKITLEREFEFRPLQPPHMCPWRGGVGGDSIYSEMVSSTMYSSSDYPLIDGFANANNQIEEQESKMNSVLDSTISHMIDLTSIRSAVKTSDLHDHILGNQALRDFVFNEIPSGSFIDTIHESCLAQLEESMNKSCVTTNDDVENDDGGYNQEELVYAAIEDLNDEQSHANDAIKNALNELNNPDPSSIHSSSGHFQSQQSLKFSSTDGLISSSFISTKSFAEHMPSLLNSKDGQSEYSYFDATKLKLFAGPNIWKFTNLLNATPVTTNASSVQQQQAPVTPHKITSVTREGTGPKRNVRVDIFNQNHIDQIMLGYLNNNNTRDRKAVSTSQSSLLLRIRERSLNQMQLARKIRPLSDLTNFYNFPELTVEHFDLINRRREQQQQQTQNYYDQDDFDHHDIEHLDDDNGPSSEMNYDFSRPVHYEKIEFAKGSSAVNAKVLKRQMIEEFTRQKTEQQRTLSLDTSISSQHSTMSSTQQNSQSQQPTVEFSVLCENLADNGYLSLHTDLASAFYCMLINCNENKLFMKNNSKCDDIFIQERPFGDPRDISTLSYSYTTHSNLSMVH